MAAEESGGCREVWWLQRNLLAAEESGGYRRRLAAEKSGGVWWLQKTMVAAEESVAAEKSSGCREVW